MLIGFTALLILPGLSNPDMSFMVMVQKVFPGWALGLVGGAGALACMIPASDLILNTSMIFTRNIYCRGFNPEADHVHQKFVARIIVFVVTATALCLAIFAPNLLVNLLLIGYSGVTQFFPMIVLGLFWKKATKLASFCGLIVGEILVLYLTFNKLDPVAIIGLHLNAGFVALMVNLIIFVVVSLITSNNENIIAKKQRLDA
jgi:SSS family solute:Na+ symporter